MELSEQALTFVVTIAIGALLGILFDFYRVVHGLIRPRAVFTSVTDFIYWVVATAIIFFGLLASNWGELRAYVFIGLCGGAIIYFRLLSRYTTAVLVRSISVLVWTVGWIRRMLNLLFFKPIAWMVTVFIKPFVVTKRKTTAWFRARLTRPPDDEENIPPKS